jgi:transposase-like protein
MREVPNGRYSEEFREEAVKLVVEGKLSIPEVGRRLSLYPSSLTNWIKAYKAGKLTNALASTIDIRGQNLIRLKPIVSQRFSGSVGKTFASLRVPFIPGLCP